jgi:ethanolamine utilization protein EutQ (cupin superfamily)
MKGDQVDAKPAVQLWKADQLNYVSVGSGDMTFCNPIAQPIGNYHAGYLNFNGGVLEWTEHGDELIWVLNGHVVITHGAEVYELDPGDLIFLKDGLSLRMTGSDDARIAYISTLNCQ